MPQLETDHLLTLLMCAYFQSVHTAWTVQWGLNKSMKTALKTVLKAFLRFSVNMSPLHAKS